MSAAAIGLSSLALLCWGVGAFFDKLSLGYLPPKAVFYGRLYLIFVLLLAPMVLHWESTRVAIWKTDRRVVAYLLGTAGFTYAGMYIYYYALNLSGASRVVPFCAIYPVVTFFLAVSLLKEPLAWNALAGAVLVALGAVMLSWS